MAPTIRPRHGKTPIGAWFSPGVFNDGGGLIIYMGRDGKLHVKRIPPRAPAFENLSVIAALTALGEQAGNTAMGKQLRVMADTMLATKGQQIRSALEKLQN